jgi:hypothetical protein
MNGLNNRILVEEKYFNFERIVLVLWFDNNRQWILSLSVEIW